MRKVFSVAMMAAMLCLVGMTKDAGATVTISLEWGACNLACTGLMTNSVNVIGTPGQTLRLDIFLSHDGVGHGGLSGHGFSINFDTDTLNELNLGAMAGIEWAGTDLHPGPPVNLYTTLDGSPATVESGTGGPTGRLNTFESVNLTDVLPASGSVYSVGTFSGTAPARYRVGQIFFTVNLALTDSFDVFSGLFNSPFDAILNSAGGGIPAGSLNFGNASVNLIPEPSTVSLLGLGLVGLVLAGRRSRRS